MIQHYLTPGAPRELNLSLRPREVVLQALRTTTHLSALTPLRHLTEQCLQHQLHPNFIRWAISNRRAPRALMLQEMTAVNVTCFISGEILLILSDKSRWTRIALAPLLFIAITMMHAIEYQFCMILTLSGVRERRPWEMFSDEDQSETTLTPLGSAGDSRDRTSASHASLDDLEFRGQSGSRTSGDESLKAAPSIVSTSGSSTRKAMGRMSPFGASNAWEQEAWVERWRRMAWWRKNILTFSMGKVPSDEPALNDIHRGIVWQAVFWAAVVTTVVVAALVAIPPAALI